MSPAGEFIISEPAEKPLKMIQTNIFKKQTHRHRKQACGTKEERKGKVDKVELRIDGYKLLYIK